MKKKYVIFAIIGLLMGLKTVKALDYYYVDDNGDYVLCIENGGCITISQDEELATFNLGRGQITFNGSTFYYDSIKEEEYQNNQSGKTRMYFYRDSSNRYVLCSTNSKSSCKTYSFEQLKTIAQISSSQIIMNNGSGPGVSGDIYTFSQEKQDEYNNRFNDSSNNANEDKTVSEVQPTTDTCTRLKEPLKFVGHIVLIFKIVIPLILIFLGIMDFFRAMTSSKDEEIKNAAKTFMFRAMAAIVIFFVPTLVSVIFSFVDSWADVKGDFNACQKCVLRVGECK